MRAVPLGVTAEWSVHHIWYYFSSFPFFSLPLSPRSWLSGWRRQSKKSVCQNLANSPWKVAGNSCLPDGADWWVTEPWSRYRSGGLVNSDQLLLSLCFVIYYIISHSGTTVLWWYPAIHLKPVEIYLLQSFVGFSRMCWISGQILERSSGHTVTNFNPH